MTGPIFVDTNVIVYAMDSSQPEKQEHAARWMEHLWRSRRGRVSMQVLHEFYVTVTRKLTPGLETPAARREVRALLPWRPVVVGPSIVEAAWELENRFSLSWWDALIVGAAQVSGCRYVLSEDLQDGQDLNGVTAVNPFLHGVEFVAG